MGMCSTILFDVVDKGENNMKIRCSFVSNSSSSSFMIYGSAIDTYGQDENIKKLFKEKLSDEDFKKFENCCINTDGEINQYEVREWYEADILPKGFSLNYMSYDEDTIYIGVDPSNADDHLTHGEWKQMIKNELSLVFGEKNLKMGWYEDCSYDS